MSDVLAPAESSGRLRSKVLGGLAWKAGSQMVLQVTRFAVALVLARLLTPGDFGLAAMVIVFAGVVVLITDSALGVALVQRRALSEVQRSTAFWLGAGIGALCTVGGIAFSGTLAGFYGQPEVRPLFVALSLGFFVGSLGTVQSALLTREMNFRVLELRLMGATLVGAATALSLAAAGFGAWAIVGQQLATVTASTVLLWMLAPWRPKLRFSLGELRGLGSFTGNVFGQNFIYYVGRSLPNVLIGRAVGASPLGVYSLANNVMLAPFNQIAAPLQQVLFPAFAQLQDDRERLAEIWIRVARLVGAIATPALVGIVVVAPDFVDSVLGHKWHAAARILRILALVGLLQALQTLNGEVLLALGKARALLNFTAIWFGANTAAVVVGLHWGIVGVACGCAAAAIVVEPLNAYITARALEMSVWPFVRAFAGIAEAAVVMGVVVFGIRALLVSQGMPALARLVLCVAVGVGVYVPVCAWRAREVATEVRGLLGGRRVSQVGAASAPASA